MGVPPDAGAVDAPMDAPPEAPEEPDMPPPDDPIVELNQDQISCVFL